MRKHYLSLSVIIAALFLTSLACNLSVNSGANKNAAASQPQQPPANGIKIITPQLPKSQPTSVSKVAAPSSNPQSAPQAAVPAPTQIVFPADNNLSIPTDTPEGVVMAFFNAYQTDLDNTLQYLSAARKNDLETIGGITGLLGFNGTLEGFQIQSGARKDNPPGAMVQVGLQVNGTQTSRIFTLIYEESQWQIDGIQMPR